MVKKNCSNRNADMRGKGNFDDCERGREEGKVGLSSEFWQGLTRKTILERKVGKESETSAIYPTSRWVIHKGGVLRRDERRKFRRGERYSTSG